MSKILVVGDFHAANHRAFGGPMENGLNHRCRDLIESCEYTVRRAIDKYGVEAVVQLGDFFDQARPPAAVVDACIRMIQRTGVPWHIMAGNHDIASYDAPTAIAPLGHVPGISVYEKPELVMLGGIPWCFLPYTGPDAKAALDRAMVAWTEKSVLGWDYFLSLPKVFCCHYGYTGGADGRADLFDPRWAQWAGRSLWLFGHEHGSSESNGFGTHLRSLGSFADYDFGDGCRISHYSMVVDTEVLGSSFTVSNSGPVFTRQTGREAVRSLFSRSLYNPGDPQAIYLRVSPGQEAEAEKYKAAGLIRDYAVHHGDPGASESGGPPREDLGYEARIAREVYETGTIGEEDQEAVYELAVSLGIQKER